MYMRTRILERFLILCVERLNRFYLKGLRTPPKMRKTSMLFCRDVPTFCGTIHDASCSFSGRQDETSSPSVDIRKVRLLNCRLPCLAMQSSVLSALSAWLSCPVNLFILLLFPRWRLRRQRYEHVVKKRDILSGSSPILDILRFFSGEMREEDKTVLVGRVARAILSRL